MRLRRNSQRLRDGPPPCIGCEENRRSLTEILDGTVEVSSEAVLTADDGVVSASVGGDLMLLERRTRRTAVLNASAALVYITVDGKRTVTEIAQIIAGELDVDPRSVLADVLAVVGRLVNMELLRDVGNPRRPSRRPTSTDLHSGRPARATEDLAGGDPVLVDVTRRVGSATCRVVTHLEEIAEAVHQLLEPLPTAPAHNETHHLFIGSDPGRHGDFITVVDGRIAGWDSESDLAIDRAAGELDRIASLASTGMITFHSGVVTRNGTSVLLLGESGSGKSTLTAALVQRGYEYLSDEVAVWDPADQRMIAYPKLLGLGGHALDLLGLGRIERPAEGAKVRVSPTKLGSIGTGGKLSSIVLLDENDEPQAAAMEKLDPTEALLSIVSHTFPDLAAPDDWFASLGVLCESVPIVCLARMPLPEMISAVDDFVTDGLIAR